MVSRFYRVQNSHAHVKKGMATVAINLDPSRKDKVVGSNVIEKRPTVQTQLEGVSKNRGIGNGHVKNVLK